MKDPWVDLVLGGEEPVQGTPARKCDSPTKNQTCEVVDKILYVPSPFAFPSRCRGLCRLERSKADWGFV